MMYIYITNFQQILIRIYTYIFINVRVLDYTSNCMHSAACLGFVAVPILMWIHRGYISQTTTFNIVDCIQYPPYCIGVLSFWMILNIATWTWQKIPQIVMYSIIYFPVFSQEFREVKLRMCTCPFFFPVLVQFVYCRFDQLVSRNVTVHDIMH